MENTDSKRFRCRHSWVSLSPPLDDSECAYDCVKNGFDSVTKNITEEQCEQCKEFKSKFIEYPITVNELKIDNFEFNTALGHKVGEMVKIRPCGNEYQKKTYLGILLGDIPMNVRVSLNDKTQTLSIKPMYNPAIFIPELNKIVFGAESWWATIKDENEITEISDELINNQWYVQILKGMVNKGKEECENARK